MRRMGMSGLNYKACSEKGLRANERENGMRKQVLAAAVVAVLALGLAGGVAWAANKVSVDVPFSFFVKDKEMPAGKYEIQPVGTDMTQLAVRGGGGAVVTPVLERLADTGDKEPTAVFDKVEGKYYLSEVHYPGMDGFLVGIAKAEETHEVIPGKQ